MSNAITVICAIFGSAGLFSMIQFLISRRDKYKDRLQSIDDRLDRQDERLLRSEKDSCRTQLLILMSDYPQDTSEIMKIAEHYFVDLKADWYLTSLFRKYLEREKITPPIWFKED